MDSERFSQPRQNDLSRPTPTSLPTLAMTLSTKGAITTQETSPGRLAREWIVKFTVTYSPIIPNSTTPIIFMAWDVTDVSRYRLQYRLNGEWRDAVLGIGCMAGADSDLYEDTPSELNVSEYYGTFRVLAPGEVWERSFSMFGLDWECPGEDGAGPAGDAFRLQCLGGPLEWWDYGRREEHKGTVVTVNSFGEVVSPKGNGGRGDFALCLCFPSESTFRHRKLLLGVYLAYFFIAIVPLIIAAVIMGSDDNKGAWDELPALFAFTPHMLWLNYVGTILAVVAIYLQARAILRPGPGPDPSEPESEVPATSEPESESTSQIQGQEELCPNQKHTPTSLSVLSLAIQSILFILLAVSWIFRVSFPPLPEGATWWDYRVLKVWFKMVGSVAVDNAVFGVGQGILPLIVLKGRIWGGRGDEPREDDEGPLLGTEREPLLGRRT
ncbi:hypothetical protein BJX62DRAFT_240463 [Aspergillus germanicus]